MCGILHVSACTCVFARKLAPKAPKPKRETDGSAVPKSKSRAKAKSKAAAVKAAARK